MVFSAIRSSIKTIILIDQNSAKRRDILKISQKKKYLKILKIFFGEMCFSYGPVCYTLFLHHMVLSNTRLFRSNDPKLIFNQFE